MREHCAERGARARGALAGVDGRPQRRERLPLGVADVLLEAGERLVLTPNDLERRLVHPFVVVNRALVRQEGRHGLCRRSLHVAAAQALQQRGHRSGLKRGEPRQPRAGHRGDRRAHLRGKLSEVLLVGARVEEGEVPLRKGTGRGEGGLHARHRRPRPVLDLALRHDQRRAELRGGRGHGLLPAPGPDDQAASLVPERSVQRRQRLPQGLGASRGAQHLRVLPRVEAEEGDEGRGRPRGGDHPGMVVRAEVVLEPNHNDAFLWNVVTRKRSCSFCGREAESSLEANTANKPERLARQLAGKVLAEMVGKYSAITELLAFCCCTSTVSRSHPAR
mmetsp:Transcript_1243/g.2985  ORF Transcript_1243/g.2985 Transcript_1243/m.2985 type:complete len:334 (+) Transcript_1243:1347-2348(+)